MNRLTQTNKIMSKLFFLLFNIILVLQLFGQNDQCKIPGIYYEPSSIRNFESLIKGSDIITWLQQQMKISTPFRNQVVKNILLDLDTSKMYVENFRPQENFIIIPLLNTRISQHVKNSQINLYLLLVEDSKHKIRRGDLALFYFRDSKLNKLPANTFYVIFSSNAIATDGTFTLVTINDVKQYEIDFCNKKEIAFRVWIPKPSKNLNCADWYLETTIFNDYQYYNDLSCIEYLSKSLGTSCNNCPPGFVCDDEMNCFE